jgi:hypothetical protein
MSALNQNAITLLAKATVNLQNGAAKSTIYTVPTGKSMIPVQVVIRNPTASLAGGTDFDLGDGANADTWKNTVNLSTMTATTDFMVIDGSNVKYTVFDAGDVFGIKPVTGATLAATATAELFGYLV